MPDDEVVQELDVEQAGGGEEFTREAEVFIGWLRVTARMVMDRSKADAVCLKDRPQ
jgi:hypothetical protein